MAKMKKRINKRGLQLEGQFVSPPSSLTHSLFFFHRPVPTVDPPEARVTAQGTVMFTVSEAGATSYLWQLNGADLPSQTDQVLMLANVMESDEGNYTCRVVTSSAGTVTSEAANLFVCKYTFWKK